MKIRFVLCHRTHSVGGEERQVFLADRMIRGGHDAAVYGISDGRADGILNVAGFAGGVGRFAADDLSQSPHRTVSTPMIDALMAEAPDLIIVKGIDYAQAGRLFDTFAAERMAVIIGGQSAHPLLARSRLIYFETQGQRDTYRGSAITAVLPKWIPWDHVVEHGTHGVDFDIINVGNFDEARKAQELLLPFAFRHRVAFVGGGRRLESFRVICAERSNVTFAGFLQVPELFGMLSRSRLMVHASTWDGYPRAVAEALAAGVPVIGLQGVLDGIVERPIIRSVALDDLHGTVFRALARPEELAGLGREASTHMRESASHEAVARAFLQPLERGGRM